MAEKQVITVSSVLQDLEEGKTRLQIKEKYGLTGKELKLMFQHPRLKNKKTKTVFEPSFVLEDDVIESEDFEDRTEVAVDASNDSADGQKLFD